MVDVNSIKQRLIDRSIVNPKTGCWEWQGHKSKNGYGMMHVSSIWKDPIGSHRVSAYAFLGIVPENRSRGKYVCHKCDNPCCVNPDHLFLATQKENMEDMIKKGRKYLGFRNCKLSADQAREIRERRKNGERGADIAKDYCVSVASVYHIGNGKRWKNLI